MAGAGYDPLAKALHWITALLVLGLYPPWLMNACVHAVQSLRF